MLKIKLQVFLIHSQLYLNYILPKYSKFQIFLDQVRLLTKGKHMKI